MQMMLPEDLGLPLFAYGVFKQGELGFLRIRDLVKEVRDDCTVSGRLLVRDGLPIFKEAESGEVTGSLIRFHSEHSEEAYSRIADLEPGVQYRWGTVQASVSDNVAEKANILIGRSPGRGSSHYESSIWTGRNDPFFKEALEVVEETIEHNREFGFDFKKLFRLQMAYLLLWTAIERYASIRYHLGTSQTRGVMQKVMKIADESAFAETLQKVVKEQRRIYRADDPTQHEVLYSDNPEKALKYYYQVRSNITHRGKAAFRDFEILLCSLIELSSIFRFLLQTAFEDAMQL